MMSDDLSQQIEDAANQPQQADTEDLRVRQHPLRDLIDADKHLQQKQITDAWAPFQRGSRKIEPPGAV